MLFQAKFTPMILIFNDLILNTKADNQNFPDSDELLILNLASTIIDNTFNIQNPIFPNFDELMTLEF
jgi:hypothetical protein